MSPKLLLGLIGGIGSGKSAVAEEFAKHGGLLIVGDRLGHEALLDPDIKRRVIECFGAGVVKDSGEIDRRKLGARVFADPKELRALESLVFPYIERRIREEIAGAKERSDVAFIVLDAAVMLEAGWNGVCDKLIFVDVPRPQRLERLARQRGWNEQEVANRERMQMELEQKKLRADFVVDNAQGPDAIPGQVRDILERLGLAMRSAS
jgi:dephospho-CoA kinase